MDTILDFFKRVLFTVFGIDILMWYVCAAGLAIVLIFIIIIACVARKKKRAAAKKSAEDKPAAEETPEPVREEKQEEQSREPEPVEEEIEPAAEEKPEPEPEKEPEFKPEPIKEPELPKEPVTETIKEPEPPAEEEPVHANNEDAPKELPKGRYHITKKSSGGYTFSLKANNGTVIFESDEYSSDTSCRNAIGTFKKNVAKSINDGTCSVNKTDDGYFVFIIKKANGSYESKHYTREASASNALTSVQKFYDTDVIETTVK